MIFKRLSASAARFNLRQSMQKLREITNNDEILINDTYLNSDKEKFMRQIIIDFRLLMDNWEIDENNYPSKKIIRDFNEYLLSGNYGSNFSYFIAYIVSKLPDKDLINFNMLLNFYSSNLKFNDYAKEWTTLSNFVKDIIHNIKKVKEDEFISKKYRNTFININSDTWLKEESRNDKSPKEENSYASNEIFELTPELNTKIENIWDKVRDIPIDYLENQNMEGLMGFYNWYLMDFLTYHYPSKELQLRLVKSLQLYKIEPSQYFKYNNTEKIFKLIKEHSEENEKKLISFEIFNKVCDILITLSNYYFKLSANKKDDWMLFKDAEITYKKLKELNKMRYEQLMNDR